MSKRTTLGAALAITACVAGCAAEPVEEVVGTNQAVGARIDERVMVGWATTSYGYANLRATPSAAGALVAKVPEGTVFTVRGLDGEFFQIYYQPKSATDSKVAPSCTFKSGEKADAVTARAKGCVVAYLSKGATVDPTEPFAYCVAPADGERQVNDGQSLRNVRFGSSVRGVAGAGALSSEIVSLDGGCATVTRSVRSILGRDLADGESLVASMVLLDASGALAGGACAFAQTGEKARQIEVKPGHDPRTAVCLGQTYAKSALVRYYVAKK